MFKMYCDSIRLDIKKVLFNFWFYYQQKSNEIHKLNYKLIMCIFRNWERFVFSMLARHYFLFVSKYIIPLKFSRISCTFLNNQTEVLKRRKDKVIYAKNSQHKKTGRWEGGGLYYTPRPPLMNQIEFSKCVVEYLYMLYIYVLLGGKKGTWSILPLHIFH